MPSIQSAPNAFRRAAVGLLAGLLVSPLTVTGQTAAGGTPPVIDLVVESSIERRPVGGELQSFRLRLKAGEFADLEVEQKGVDVAVALLDPKGARLLAIDGLNEALGVEPVAVVATTDGDYLLTVQAPPQCDATYAVRVLALRPASDADRRWTACVESLARATTLNAAKTMREAIAESTKALALAEKETDPTSPRLIPFLENAGRYAAGSRDTDSARPILTRALGIAEAAYGTSDDRIVGLLDALGMMYTNIQNDAAAEPLLSRALSIREQNPDAAPAALATLLHRIGILEIRRGRPLKAEPLLVRALAIREKVLGPDNVYVAQTSDELAVVYENQGRLEEARLAVTRALVIREKAFGPEHEFVAQTLSHLGNVYQQLSQYSKAEPLLLRALAIREKLRGPDDPKVAETLGGLGVLYHYRGQNTRAIPLFERCLVIQENSFGPESNIAAMNLSNLSAAYRELGQYRRSEDYIQRALAMFEKLAGPNHPTLAIMFSNLGALQIRLRDFEGADASYTRMISILETSVGKSSLNLSLGLQNLAEAARQRGQLERADALVRRAIAMQESLGSGHYFTAAACVILARIALERGRISEAIESSSKGIAMFTSALGQGHPLIASSYASLALAHLSAGDVPKAVEFIRQANDSREIILAQDLVAGSERAKRDFLKLATREFDSTLSIHAQFAQGDATALGVALQLLLRRKGRALDVMSDAIGNLRRNAAPEDVALLDDLIDARTRLSSMSLAGPGQEPPETYKANVKALEDRIDAIESDVSQRSTRYRIDAPPTVTVGAVQRSIPAGAALVEFASYHSLNPTGNESTMYGAARYAAYVLPAEGPPRWVDLGEAKSIDELVDRFRTSLRDPKSRDARALGREVDRAVMQPVRRLTGSTKRLLVSPDGLLNLVPFAALVDERGRYLVETLSMTYLTSGRDLLRHRNVPNEDRTSTILADPAFGDSSGFAAETTRDVVQTGGLSFGPLPGTAVEARALAGILPRSVVLLERDATETAVKSMHGPEVLHIATHGFFIDGSGPDFSDGNPLVRSGLALAGANERRSGNEDGVLTALEVAGLDLWGTQLVVLSACNTGLGETRTGEGVSGLRRALVLAGSESQVISLWSVSDAATRELMVSMYRQLLAGDGRTDALRRVQLEMLRSRRTSHPFYWAGFIQSGDWRPLAIAEP